MIYIQIRLDLFLLSSVADFLKIRGLLVSNSRINDHGVPVIVGGGGEPHIIDVTRRHYIGYVYAVGKALLKS
jgi:hypothetical protein